MWFGLAKRRTLILPSWKALVLLAVLAGALGFTFLRGAYPFLAPNRPLAKAEVLIVEGWVTDATLARAQRELESGACDLICTVGVELSRGAHLLEWKDWAHAAKATLLRLGVPREKVLAAPGGAQQRHRTFASFEAAHQKLAAMPNPPRTLNLLSEAHHGRRSATVARKVFGESVKIGVISAPPDSYDPNRWWASSSGAKNVLMECMAFAYERLADSGR